MRIIDSFLQELEQEAKTTRKFLQALPADQLGWKPHEKSTTAGKLAMHIATLPRMMADWGSKDELSMDGGPKGPEETATKDAILAAFEQGLVHAKELLAQVDDQKAMGMWKLNMGGKTLMEMPRVGFYRYWMMNHLYHHRGQIGVYLRLLGAPVPASYGPSADENPMAELLASAKA